MELKQEMKTEIKDQRVKLVSLLADVLDECEWAIMNKRVGIKIKELFTKEEQDYLDARCKCYYTINKIMP